MSRNLLYRPPWYVRGIVQHVFRCDLMELFVFLIRPCFGNNRLNRSGVWGRR